MNYAAIGDIDAYVLVPCKNTECDCTYTEDDDDDGSVLTHNPDCVFCNGLGFELACDVCLCPAEFFSEELSEHFCFDCCLAHLKPFCVVLDKDSERLLKKAV